MYNKGVIVGLGNPGKNYEKTRHNIGFIIIDELIKKTTAHKLSEEKFSCKHWEASISETSGKWIIAKPQTYMNLSGNAVQPLIAWYKTSPNDLLIIHDEIDLPLGRMKLKYGGGTAGHNGLKSIAQQLGTPDFYRLRIGIGRSPYPTESVAQWVLGKLLQDELHMLHETIQIALNVITLFTKQNIDEAMALANSFLPQEHQSNKIKS